MKAVPEILERILARRGMSPDDMRRFLYPDYERDLHDPFLLTDMDKAVDRILRAARDNERVAVYGDYDIDGITASAVLLEAFAALGVQAESYIPDRFEEGYGINQGALEVLRENGVHLVVSVDCGITSVDEASWAREHGLDLVITDHHTVPEELPDAVAVVNPKRPGDAYPFKELAGVGVAFKMVQALQMRAGAPEVGQEKWLLDLVALGTVCDVVPLVGENRVLASYGLKVLRRTRRAGLKALAAASSLDIAGTAAYHLGFVLGPRMNAAGRLDHAAGSLELVTTSDARRAGEIALELEELNRQRRETQDAIFRAADEMASLMDEDDVLVLAHPDWSHGVVGIVASKVAEKWQKPTLVAQILGDITKGSARSAGTLSMVDALRANEQLLSKYGGHVHAAGYTLATAQLDALRAGLNEYYRSVGAVAGASAVAAADLQFDELGAVDLEMIRELELLEPHGSGNPRPVVEVAGVKVGSLSRIGKQKQHLRVSLADGRGHSLAGVGFGLCEKYPDLQEGAVLTVRGVLNKNEYRDVSSAQMLISEFVI